MQFIWQGLVAAVHLLLHPTADLVAIIRVTLELAFWSTVLALLIGLPIGLLLGLGRFPGRRLLLSLANAGLGLPPVVVGLVVTLLMFRRGPLGRFSLIYTVPGMVVAQTVLAVPIVVAITAAAVQSLEPGLLDQARALGAGRAQVGVFALREARTSLAVATIGAMGSALSEVGAVVLVGGNIDMRTRTAAGAILTSISGGRYAEGIAVGIILLGMVFVLASALTLVQQSGSAGSGRRSGPRSGNVRSLAIGGR